MVGEYDHTEFGSTPDYDDVGDLDMNVYEEEITNTLATKDPVAVLRSIYKINLSESDHGFAKQILHAFDDGRSDMRQLLMAVQIMSDLIGQDTSTTFHMQLGNNLTYTWHYNHLAFQIYCSYKNQVLLQARHMDRHKWYDQLLQDLAKVPQADVRATVVLNSGVARTEYVF